MFKALALEAFGFQFTPKTKAHSVKTFKTANISWRFYAVSALMAMNLVLLMSYVYGVNRYASAGYEIKSLQKKVATLNEEHKKNNLKVSEAGSMVGIQNDFLGTNFVPAGSAKFLQVEQNQFSLK